MILLENCIRNISIYLQQMNLIKCPPRRQHEHWLDSGDCQLFYKLSHEDISVSLGSMGNTSPKEYQNMRLQTSLVVQWLRFCTSTAGGRASNPGRGTKILHAMWWEWKKKMSLSITSCQELWLKKSSPGDANWWRLHRLQWHLLLWQEEGHVLIHVLTIVNEKCCLTYQ